jgi:methyl-accepting chemotaxis protein
MAVTKEIVLEVGIKDSTAQGTTSAKQRLRELQKTLIDMSLAGQDGTKAFKEMEREAGKLKDQIGDTSQRIKTLASDTVRIDTVVSAVQGITAGFQIAQGAAALFGSENEDLQK